MSLISLIYVWGRKMDFAKILKEKQLKVTPQRIAILNELQRSGHSCIENIFNNIKKQVPSISLATVYKNIVALNNYNVIKSVNTPNQKQQYEINIKPHVHLFCSICEKLEDFDIDTSDFTTLCEKASGYKDIYDASIMFRGKCSKCANS